MRLQSFFETGRGKVGLDFFLFFIAALSLLAVFVATDKHLFERLYDVALGVLISVAFYYLVVRLPEFQKRQRLKRNLRSRYAIFRRECIQIVVQVADGVFDPSECAQLMSPSSVSEYLRQEIADGQTRWDAFETMLISFTSI